MERLDKIIASSSSYSRKEARKLVATGRVEVSGLPATSFDMKIEESAIVKVDGVVLERPRRIVAVLNKPAGYVTSTDDPSSLTVMSLVPPSWRKWEVYPVGRLDKETEGLLIFTNDGELAHKLLSPRYRVEKEYYAEHEGVASEEDVKAFESGVTLSDGTRCLPAVLEILDKGHSNIIVHEGKYHQVRRMMASRGLAVTYLRRIREGRLLLGNLKKGEWRLLDEEEERLLL